jgi:hypothetical protein
MPIRSRSRNKPCWDACGPRGASGQRGDEIDPLGRVPFLAMRIASQSRQRGRQYRRSCPRPEWVLTCKAD